MEKVIVTGQDMRSVDFYLREAREWGLEVEIVSYALKYMKEDPSICIIEALSLASAEWIK